MKVAVPCWENRVSPVFDTACNMLLIDIQNGNELKREKKFLSHSDPLSRSRHIALLGTDVLVCGAISRKLEFTLQSAGVRVISNICGPVESVIQAFLSGRLCSRQFHMPGCSMHGADGSDKGREK